MNAQTHDAYLAIIDDAEARVARAKDREHQNAELLDRERAVTQRLSQQIDVRDAAARAIVADCRVPRGDYLGDACRWCENTIDRDGHRPGCPVGILAATLEDA